MNLYAIVGSGVVTPEAAALRARLSAWHDAMVAHERRLRTGLTTDRCDEECPHVAARTLWAEAVAIFGADADDLAFLRSRGAVASVDAELIAPATSCSKPARTVEPATGAARSATAKRPKSSIGSSRPSRTPTAELQP